jgi:MtfA peptidase
VIILKEKYNLIHSSFFTLLNTSQAPLDNNFALVIAVFIMSIPFIWWFIIYRLFPNGMNDFLLWRWHYTRKMSGETYSTLLEKYMLFYGALSEKQKKIFVKKLDYLHRKTNFIIDDGVDWKKENEVILLAYFVKLILHYPRFNYFSLNEITVLPSSFYLAYYGQQPLKGLTKKQGEVYLSWISVLEGIKIGDDGINLIIHEAAHAFVISADHHRNNYRKLINNVNNFFVKVDVYLDIYRNAKPDILRKYALVNEDEFFACCVELFFEKNETFKKELPELFEDIRCVLNFPELNKHIN